MTDSRRIVIEFDFPGCGDAMLAGVGGLMTRALRHMVRLSRYGRADARGGEDLGYCRIKYVHSYFDSENVR